MSKRFRLPCKQSSYIGEGRPTKPNWMYHMLEATRNQKRNFSYWTQIYQVTPPWVGQEIVKQLKEIYLNCPEGYEVDHIVPLNNPLVSGLHLPWNLQYLSKAENQYKSNTYWPDCPITQGDMFKC